MYRLFLALACLLLVACDGIGPGDYRVYRVAFTEVELADNCFSSGAVPVDTMDDSSSLYQSGTYVLFVGADDKFYLDTGTVALRGSESGELKFNFEGQSTVVTVEGDPNDPTTRTQMTDISVTFNVTGEVVEGSQEDTIENSCTGPNCSGNEDNTCTRSAPFIGGEVADVDVKHEV